VQAKVVVLGSNVIRNDPIVCHLFQVMLAFTLLFERNVVNFRNITLYIVPDVKSIMFLVSK